MRIDRGIIVTASEYLAEIYETTNDDLDDIIDWDETGDNKFPVSMKEFNALTDIIALQMSYFCLRRVTHSCQSNTDAIYSMLQKKYKEYSDEFGKEFNNLNAGKLS